MNYKSVTKLRFSLAVCRYPSGFFLPWGKYTCILKNLGKSGGFEMELNKLINLCDGPGFFGVRKQHGGLYLEDSISNIVSLVVIVLNGWGRNKLQVSCGY